MFPNKKFITTILRKNGIYQLLKRESIIINYFVSKIIIKLQN